MKFLQIAVAIVIVGNAADTPPPVRATTTFGCKLECETDATKCLQTAITDAAKQECRRVQRKCKRGCKIPDSSKDVR